MDEKIGQHGLLQRGLEGVHKIVGQIAHETHRVGEQERLAGGQENLARGGVERGEEFVLDEHIGAGEPLEQRGFAGVGVADNGGVGQRQALTALALGGARRADMGDLGFEFVDVLAHEPAVGLDLAPPLRRVRRCRPPDGPDGSRRA